MKIGFFGGAFDPFHSEHKHLAECAISELGLDKLVIYPSYAPPHKACSAPYSARRRFIELAIEDLSKAEISDVEKETGKDVNPTVETLPLLKAAYPADEQYFIIGGDSLINFDRWIHPEKIARIMKIAAIARENVDEVYAAAEKVKSLFGADVKVLKYVGKCVSGSTVRAKLEFGEKPEEICSAVYEEIRKSGIYRVHQKEVDLLKKNISEKTFEHAKRTVLYALKLNVKLGLPYEKVFMAALFHDCAKHIHNAVAGDALYPVEHQFIGREVARNVYGIEDEEVLTAIEFHTTGKPDMTTLSKLIFCADMLEEGRTYAGVSDLRKEIESDFEKGFVTCVNASLRAVEESGKEVYPLTRECAEYYNKPNRK